MSKAAAAVSGQHLLRALAYALKAVPKDDAGARLQHVSFFRHKIVGADGQRWHVGLLPIEAAVSLPVAVTKSSADELVMALDYCRRVAKRHSASFEVRLEREENNLVATIRYGAKHEIEHKLYGVDVGQMPLEWREPVPDTAPELQGKQSEIHCGHMIDATKWYRAWEKDHGSFRTFGVGGSSPVRLDIACGGDLVAQAYLLPVDHPPAELAPDEPLLEGVQAEKRSQSNLDLVLGGDGAPYKKPEAEKKGKRRKKAPASPHEVKGAPNGESEEPPTDESAEA